MNEDGEIWVDRLASGREYLGKTIGPALLLDALGTIAALLDTEINKYKPSLQGELPIDDGSRVQGIIPPITAAPVVVIRKRASSVFPLEDYMQKNKLSTKQYDLILSALTSRKNILVSGGTGSGKTTFCNALLLKLSEISPNDRVVIMEDTTELQCRMRNSIRLHTCKDVATLNDLLRMTMRLSPDRIVIGEVRGGEALDLLKSWNTGHPGGFATVHANSAASALPRLEQLISEVSTSPMRELVAEAVNIVIHLQRHAIIGPKVEQIIRVDEVKSGEYVWEEV